MQLRFYSFKILAEYEFHNLKIFGCHNFSTFRAMSLARNELLLFMYYLIPTFMHTTVYDIHIKTIKGYDVLVFG
jgi:hypothetical protein